MSINFSVAYSAVAKAGNAGDSASKLDDLLHTINTNWKVDEMAIVYSAVKKIEQKLRQQSSLLQSLESDIRNVAREIEHEEELERQRLAKLEQEWKERKEKENNIRL